jgi:hypothetical protein
MRRGWVLLILLTAFAASAQSFRFHRNIQSAGQGPQRLDVDLPLLGHCSAGLADLRLFDGSGREVPYVLVPPPGGEAPWKSGRLLPLPETKGTSGFELDLGGTLHTARLSLVGLRPPFLKRFRLEGSGDRQRWTELVKEGSLFDLPEEGLKRLEVDFPSLLLEVGGSGPLLREATVAESRLQSDNLAPVPLGQSRLRRESGISELRIPISEPEGSDLDLRVEDGSNSPLGLKSVKAEVEPQPWIYFELSAPGTLIARFGDPKLPAPRYDLEALREKLMSAKPPMAHWGELQPISIQESLPPFLLDPGVGSAMDAGSFQYRRTIPDGATGLVALVLDPHVLAHSPRLQDLRILDGRGNQIPYLLEQRDEPLSLDLALPAGIAKGRSTVYTLTLPQSNLSSCRIVLETSARVFERRVILRGGAENAVLQEALWIHGDPGLPPVPLTLPVPLLQEPTLTLEIDEGDNQPLPVKSARLLLPTWRLRFFHPGKGLKLCYGQDLESPRYDLALLAGRLRNASPREITPLALEREVRDKTPHLIWIFWGVLVIAVLTLLFLLARLLKRPGEKT